MAPLALVIIPTVLLCLGLDLNMSPRRVIYNSHPLFGRLPRAGRKCLLEKGFKAEAPPEETQEQLSFIWPSKSGPKFDVHSASPAQVRPYPKNITDVVDDKRLLYDMLSPFQIMPECLSVENVSSDEDGLMYFVKHRLGAQGKSVYALNKEGVASWAKRCKNQDDFVIQREVIPALDDEGRKFVLRAHILLYYRGDGVFKSALHQDVICLSHSSKYSLDDKSSHISQAGKKHPSPKLVDELSPLHPAFGAFSRIHQCSQTLIKATADSFPQPHDSVTCFALLGADFLVSNEGHVKLCEVNSHPALGWGSMKQVDPQVFNRLVQEMLDVLVFDTSLENTGFRPL